MLQFANKPELREVFVRFPIAIEAGDGRHAFGVVVPDLPGCFSAGDTLEEAITQSEEAILLTLEDMLERGLDLPMPSSIEKFHRKREFRGWLWAIVQVDLSKLSPKAVRVNITLPQRTITTIDAYAKRHGETRSGFLARAALNEVQREARGRK